MKVSELFESESMNEYVLRLIQRVGAKHIGSGAYAHVFQHQAFPDIVVKIFKDDDKSYKQYIDWVQEHQDNPYLPNIVNVSQYTSAKGKFNFVFMDKMRPITETRLKTWIESVFGTAASKAYVKRDYETLFDSMIEKSLTKSDPYLGEFISFISSFGWEELDISASNVMVRNDHIVFTDPIGAEPSGARADDLVV